MTSKSLEVAYDKIGNEIRVGSIVIAPYTASMILIAKVTRITPKQVQLTTIGDKTRGAANKSHNEVVCVDDAGQIVMYMMSQNL